MTTGDTPMTTMQDTENDGQIVEATVVTEEPGTAVATQELQGNLFNTDDPVEVVERAARVANALRDVIQQRKLYVNIQGKSHVQVEGWQLLGSMLGVTAVCTDTEIVDGGWKATVEARTLDGRVIGCADALCTKYEKRGPWKNADDYARLSMAQTRATSKALKGPLGFVVSLAGYQTTSPEEMEGVVGPEQIKAPAPADEPGNITRKDARALAETVDRCGALDSLQLAISHVTGREAKPCESVPKAAEALYGLDREQAARIHSWAERKAQEAGA